MQIKGLQIFLSELARKKNGVLFPLCTVLSSKAVSCVSMPRLLRLDGAEEE